MSKKKKNKLPTADIIKSANGNYQFVMGEDLYNEYVQRIRVDKLNEILGDDTDSNND